jgi:hypothetical protein
LPGRSIDNPAGAVAIILYEENCATDIGSRSVRCHDVASRRLDHGENHETGKNKDHGEAAIREVKEGDLGAE